MTQLIRILLQTLGSTYVDSSFTALSKLLAGASAGNGLRMRASLGRDRESAGEADQRLSTLDAGEYDELWLLTLDPTVRLTEREYEGIANFRRGGGGVLVAGGNSDLVARLRTRDASAGTGRALAVTSFRPFSDDALDVDGELPRVRAEPLDRAAPAFPSDAQHSVEGYLCNLALWLAGEPADWEAQRERLEHKLDEALKMSFPASDPIAV